MGSAEVGKNTARWRERERVFLNIASESVFKIKVNQSTKPMYEYHVPVHSGFDIHEKQIGPSKTC